jgi:hypothetical protein
LTFLLLLIGAVLLRSRQLSALLENFSIVVQVQSASRESECLPHAHMDLLRNVVVTEAIASSNTKLANVNAVTADLRDSVLPPVNDVGPYFVSDQLCVGRGD